MKINKELVKQIIKEELESALEEQTSFSQAGRDAARKKAKEMEGPGAVAKFLDKKSGGVNVATDMLAKAAGELEKAGETKSVAKAAKPRNTSAIKAVQKQLGVKADGLIGPKTVAAYNMKIKPSDPMTIPVLKNIMRREPTATAELVGSMLARRGAAQAVATAAGPKSAGLSPDDQKEVDAELKKAFDPIEKALEDAEEEFKPLMPIKESFERFLK